MRKYIEELSGKVLRKEPVSKEEAIRLLDLDKSGLFYLFASANNIRQYFRGNKVSLCAITNAKSGNCSEDCKFCAQSARHNTNIEIYPLLTPEEMFKRAKAAYQAGAHRFCFVTSGAKLSDAELVNLCLGISRIKKEFPLLKLDSSLGKIDLMRAKKLKDAGLDRYNHNIETHPDFFSKICTTHSFSDRLATIEILKKAGLEVCSGGIFGMGETNQQRVEFAFILKDLDVDSVALNFLNPVSGTGLGKAATLPALEILKIVAVLRFILPEKELRLCGGRQKNLRQLQALAFVSGIDAAITGDYLTTKGSPYQDDLEMLSDLGFSL
ncbi:MAG: biotin synthase BioB [Candidatus Omnitrophica bacterium]|nr:biotin synthase BioB [Candidatus Omnitrophota bacterium]MDD5237059.1 biotin synthase BioB [Candidatus Omnitrophota bacterium]MDD5611222.1 biotin synthase BioB [Candidatus Omnitrophota bacterium]